MPLRAAASGTRCGDLPDWNMYNATDHLGVFAKYWQPGTVKTRLGATLGVAKAARLHELFVRVLLHRFASTTYAKRVCFSPEDRQAEFAAIAGADWTLVPQGTGGLGERLHRFFESSFHAGASKV